MNSIKAKLVNLPPRPGKVVKPEIKEAQPKKVASPDSQKAVLFKVELADGTYLQAEGDHAADVYAYLMDCERYCASRQGTVMIYMGPHLYRYDSNGIRIN